VRFGATSASFTVASDTRVVAVAPPGSGSVGVVVTTRDGDSAPATYSYTPVVTGVSPASGSVSGGTDVTITGAGFTGATSVTFGGTAATDVSVVSDGEIHATTPPGNAGTVGVGVGAGTGGRFTYELSISGLNPDDAYVGNTVTISGIGFADATGVRFGGVATGFAVVSDTEILATAPAGEGTVDVTVETPHGTTPLVASDRFGYGVPPSVSPGPSTTPAPRETPGTKPGTAQRVAATLGSLRIVGRRELVVDVSVQAATTVRLQLLDARGARLAFSISARRAATSQALSLRDGAIVGLALRPSRALVRGHVYRVRVIANGRDGTTATATSSASAP
jgi:hypothetical protein